jgi:hypothetical protein
MPPTMGCLLYPQSLLRVMLLPLWRRVTHRTKNRRQPLRKAGRMNRLSSKNNEYVAYIRNLGVLGF